MKLIAAIILLACFISVNSQSHFVGGARVVTRVHSDFVPGFIVDFVENLVQQALSISENVLANFNQFVTSSLDMVQQILATAREGLDKIISAVQQKLEELGELCEKVRQCVDPYIPELEAIRSQARQDAENCTADALSYINSIKDKVQNQTSAIGEAVESLRNVVDKCAHEGSLFAVIQCILSEGQDIFSAIASIAANTLDALKIASKEYITIDLSARQCVRDVLAESEAEQAAILRNITQCINGTNIDGVY